MKQEYSRQSLIPSVASTLVAFFLVIMLAACNSTAATFSSPAGTSPGKAAQAPTRVPTTSSVSVPARSPDVLHANVANITVKTGHLLIQSVEGFLCPYNEIGPVDQLVLASDRTNYSQNEIAQMRAYIETNSGTNAANFLTKGAEPPPTLRWVLGGSADAIPGAFASSSCGANLMLTNTGNTPIQIPEVGVQLETRPQQNSYQYHLIDACSLIQCGPGPGSSGSCDVYNVSIPLGLGEKNTVFSAVPFAYNAGDPSSPNCGTLTIAPATQVNLIFYFPLAPKMPKNLIYSISPIFTVDTAQGKQTLSLPQLVSTLAFASASQFSCYTLQGTKFIRVPSPGVSNLCI
ncbi:MAG: hypothetical protein ACYDER_12475 [Ktedonobacteraceae bacterium]